MLKSEVFKNIKTKKSKEKEKKGANFTCASQISHPTDPHVYIYQPQRKIGVVLGCTTQAGHIIVEINVVGY